MAIIISGASGQFGRAAAELALETAGPEEVILTTRTPEKLADLAKKGATVRAADFDDPSSLADAFAGGDKMLLISTARVGTRVEQHANAITTARAAGVRHIAYTSIVGADRADNPAIVRLDHRATEELLEQSGLAWTFLRDSQYADAVAGVIAPVALMRGNVPGSAGDGRVAFVSRADCVASAVAVLTKPGHENQAYDLTGPELWSFPEAMALVSQIAGRPVDYVRVTDDDMFEYFDSMGAPRHASDKTPDGPIPWSSDDMVTFERAIREGFFDILTDNVERLTGRKPQSLRDVLLEHKPMWPAPTAA